MLDFAGSLIISVIGYFDLKKQRKGIADLTLDTDDEINSEQGENVRNLDNSMCKGQVSRVHVST